MHEFSLAARVLENVLEFSDVFGTGEVLRVRLEVGDRMGVEAEQLKFCYDSVKQMTPLKDSTLEVELVPGTEGCAIKAIDLRDSSSSPSGFPLNPFYTDECDTFHDAIRSEL